MKRVSKLKNTYRASYRYYKLMKEVLTGGEYNVDASTRRRGTEGRNRGCGDCSKGYSK